MAVVGVDVVGESDEDRVGIDGTAGDYCQMASDAVINDTASFRKCCNGPSVTLFRDRYSLYTIILCISSCTCTLGIRREN